MKITALDFLAFFLPLAILIAFYGFNIHWKYLALIGLPLSFIVYFFRIKNEKKYNHDRTQINTLSIIIGIILIITIYIYYSII
ncbi:hypothetical protein QE390_002460 [Siphonobacter sp. SORGH_AS 1065]|nr:hypothetical protein [Siphonobacter sp. SORGH_AS_1065]